MIDLEVKIFNNVYEVASQYLVVKRFVSTPLVDYTKLPAASLYEMDSATYRYRQSSTPVENFSLITYQLDVAAATKAECRKIFAALDERMISLNFSRISGQYVTYPDNPNIVRYVARYEAVADTEGNLYRR